MAAVIGGRRGSMDETAFVYPDFASVRDFGLVRVGGSGLANCLISWARASVLADRTGGRRIAATWPSLRIGPILRREKDVRLYAGLFVPEADAVTGVRKLHLLARCKRRVFALPSDIERAEPGTLYVCDGSRIVPEYFEGLFAHRDDLRRRLLAMTRQRWKDRAAANQGADIAVHVRLGDFLSAPTPGMPAFNVRIPVEWYRDRIERIRAEAGRSLTVRVFSDGSDAELAPLLAMRDVERARGGNSIADILALSRSAILVSSGSTFSMWAAFLGEGASISHPGRLFQRVKAVEALEIESATGSALPTTFLEQVFDRGIALHNQAARA
jgi:hypothetical protein